jgi:hypothetical protein
MRTRLLRGGHGRLDASAVAQGVESARHALSGARAITGSLTGATRNLEAARQGFGALIEAVTSQLERIEALVRPADDVRKAA